MIKPITSVKCEGKRVLVRAGFDVPLEKNVHTEEMEVADDTRIKDIMPTLKYLMEQKAKIVIVSHLKRPEGWDKSLSMWPVAQKLGEMLDMKVNRITDNLPEYKVPGINFLDADITKTNFVDLSQQLIGGDILFLENIRFYKGEPENTNKFIEILAAYGDIYVNDAFSVSHRKEASTYGVAKILPSYAGVSLLKEIQALNKVLKNPAKPLVVIMGGAKVADKSATIANLAKVANYILLGGALGNSFLKAAGYETGKSKVADVDLAKQLLRNYKDKLILPVDVVVAKSEDGEATAMNVGKIKSSDMMFDIGPETVLKFSKYIYSAKTLVWNGPMGLIEQKKFSFGSSALAQVFATKSKGPAFGVVGGGETLEVVARTKVGEFIDHISTGGGAMLEFLAGKELPGIKILDN